MSNLTELDQYSVVEPAFKNAKRKKEITVL